MKDVVAIAVATTLGFAGVAAAKTPTGTVIYELPGKALGESPMGSLLQDSTGALYGTSFGYDLVKKNHKPYYGSVFKLTPPAAGSTTWTPAVLYLFQGKGDGGRPGGGLVVDKAGALYGTEGGGVFKLTPPVSGQTAWTESVLYSNTYATVGNLLWGRDGTLYGVNLGEVFCLTPPSGGATDWTPSVLYQFPPGSYPNGGLISDRSGALYGTTALGGTANVGTVYKLVPPSKGQTAWTQDILYSFQGGTSDGARPMAGVVTDSAGALYGTTYAGGAASGGTVFMLVPPAQGQTAWTETLLHSFSGPDGAFPVAALTKAPGGVFYGTAEGGGGGSASGVVFKLTPPKSGQPWIESTYYDFSTSSSDPSDASLPEGSVIRSKAGVLYGTTFGGGLNTCRQTRCGTVYQIAP